MYQMAKPQADKLRGTCSPFLCNFFDDAPRRNTEKGENMGGNFFKVDRSIFDHSIWQDPVQFRIFFYLVGKAVFAKEGRKYGNVHVKRGQFLRSFRGIRDDLQYVENNAIKKYSLSKIHRAIDKLIDSNMIRKHETELGTLFEVVNYEKYQGSQQSESGAWNGAMNEDGTPPEQQRNNNKNVNTGKKEKNNIQQQLGEPAENWMNTYQMNYGQPTMKVIHLMNSYLDDGMEQKTLSFALEKAAENGQQFPYAKGILNKWLDKGILTYEAAAAEEEEYQKRKVERIHGNETSKRPKAHWPVPNVRGTDPRQLDFSTSRNSL